MNMNNPERKDFTLDKVKLVKDGGLDVIYKHTIRDGQATYINEVHEKRLMDVHPDLTAKMKELKPVLAHVYHLTAFRNIVQAEDFKATDKQKEAAEEAYQNLLDKINVSGFALSGQDNNIGIIITGTFTADSNQKMAVNSHRMKFSDTRYGFEEEMESIITDIEEEVYQYLFENKKAQLSLFDTVPEGEKELPFDGKAAAAGEGKDDDDEEFPDVDDPMDNM